MAFRRHNSMSWGRVLKELDSYQKDFPDSELWTGLVSDSWLREIENLQPPGPKILHIDDSVAVPVDNHFEELTGVVIEPAHLGCPPVGREPNSLRYLMEIFLEAADRIPEDFQGALHGGPAWLGGLNAGRYGANLWMGVLWYQSDRDDWFACGSECGIVPPSQPSGSAWFCRSPIQASIAAIKNCRLDTGFPKFNRIPETEVERKLADLCDCS